MGSQTGDAEKSIMSSAAVTQDAMRQIFYSLLLHLWFGVKKTKVHVFSSKPLRGSAAKMRLSNQAELIAMEMFPNNKPLQFMLHVNVPGLSPEPLQNKSPEAGSLLVHGHRCEFGALHMSTLTFTNQYWHFDLSDYRSAGER